MIIQIILTAVFLLLLLRVLPQKNLGYSIKLFVIALIIVASYVVLFPKVTNRVAEFAGVGRGVDLIIYLCIAVGAYLLTVFYIRLRTTELRIARLVQRLAIETNRLEELQTQINVTSER